MFCSEKISRINSQFSQSLMVNLSVASPFFSSFFQDVFLFPTFQEKVQFELADYILKNKLKKVERYSLYKNYIFYFLPVFVVGIFLLVLLIRKLISERNKTKYKYG